MSRPRMRMGAVAAFVCVMLLSARVSHAELRVNDFEITLFARTWHVTSYFVQDDLLANSSEDTFLEPEGLAFRDGMLYASGDREDDETDSRLARYVYPPDGLLSFDDFIQMPNTAPDWWGPEGLTFNTSGSGYGGGASELVSVERDVPSRAGVVNLASGAVSNTLTAGALEDVTFLPGDRRFAVLMDLDTSIRLAFHDRNMVPTDDFFEVLPGSNGLAAVSASFGSWFTRTTQADETLIVVTKAAPGNAVVVYGHAGDPIGGIHELPIVPKAWISLGGGFYRLLPAFGTVEALAVDEARKVLFVGDEQNGMIHVLTPVRPATDFDADGDVDLADFGTFQACFNGPNRAPARTTCGPADSDSDGDVDLGDFCLFQTCFNGPNRPPKCD